MNIHLDFETRSKANLKKEGMFRYSEDSSTLVLCAAYCIDDSAIQLWRPGQPIPSELRNAIENRAVVYAHNAGFELLIWNNVLRRDYPKLPRLNIDQMRDTAAMAAAMGLPRSLEHASLALKLKTQKEISGKSLIKQLCQLQNDGTFSDDPAMLDNLYDYCKQDVAVEMDLAHRLPELSKYEQKVWEQTHEINKLGVPIDPAEVICLSEVVDKERDRLSDECRVITGCKPSQNKQLLAWLAAHGCSLPNLQALTIKDNIENYVDEVRQVLEIRQLTSGTATKKFAKMLEMVSKDGNLKGQFIYYGCATGRFSSKGINIQNLARPPIKRVLVEDVLHGKYDGKRKLKALASCVRSVIKSPAGKVFIDADFSSIENRVAYWLVGDKEHLQTFINGQDEYVQFASTMYGKQADLVTTDDRQIAKSAVLGCMYGLGGMAYKDYAVSYGVVVSESEAKLIVSEYRSTHPLIVGGWGNCEEAAINAVRDGCAVLYNKLKFDSGDPEKLEVVLPSGRAINYRNPYVGTGRFGGDVVKVTGVDTKSRRYCEIDLYSSRLFQNIVQAVARDLIVDALMRIPASLGNVIASFHDELLILTTKDNGEKGLKELIKIMSTPPCWAKDLPLGADGWYGERFRK